MYISNPCYFFPIINCCLKITNNFFFLNVKQVTHHLVSNIPTLRTENFYFSFSLEIVCCERKHACAAEMSWNSISPSHMPFTDSRSRDCLDLLIEQLGQIINIPRHHKYDSITQFSGSGCFFVYSGPDYDIIYDH